MADEVNIKDVDAIVDAVGTAPEAVIPILQALQARYHYLPAVALKRVCARTAITPAVIQGVATFYAQFRLRPAGEHTIRVCHGTACHVKGSENIQEALVRYLRVPCDCDTSPDNAYTIERVACLGCCTLAPVVQVDRTTFGHLTADGIGPMLADAAALAGDVAGDVDAVAGDAPGAGAEIRVGLGSCCMVKGSDNLFHALRAATDGLGLRVAVKRVGCVGMCHQTPIVEVHVPDHAPVLYARVTAGDAGDIVRRHFRPVGARRRAARWFEGLLAHGIAPDGGAAGVVLDPRSPPAAAFLGRQVRIATEGFGELDPLDLDEYLSCEGFAGLERALTLEPGAIIREIEQSGLRGRGGAGFPTGLKWSRMRAAPAPDGQKVVVVNGDEGDPGAFMDRMLMESFPYRVIEGVLIAARAVGASEGVIYVRAEYPRAVSRLRTAIERLEARGYLGARVAGRDFAFRLRLFEGAGAFVCGEETALIESIEGRRGVPRFKPPYPAERGLHGRPTLINNVETFTLVPWILRRGAAAFSALGTADSKGTKVFALAGEVVRTGLIEVPMGITLREIVEEVGGGCPGGRPFKAVQIGGPSGGCIPAALADLPVDFQALTEAGAIMGSGGLIVLDADDCMVDVARYFMSFLQTESCGTCTFCRVGTKRMLEILDRLCAGRGKLEDLDRLEEVGQWVRQGSLCGLGRTAPNPVLSTLRHFRAEYEAHVQGRCPAGKCKALIAYEINERCIGCTRCAQRCPVNAIAGRPFERHVIDNALCTRCDTCRQACPTGAVRIVSRGRPPAAP